MKNTKKEEIINTLYTVYFNCMNITCMCNIHKSFQTKIKEKHIIKKAEKYKIKKK